MKMAYHFSANQFEEQYSPRKLGNWEYPKWYPERPRQRFKSTKIIADESGRLLEGVKRGGNAWGNYVGTWDLPRRITREYVKKITAPDERLIKHWSIKKKESAEAAEERKARESVKDRKGVKATDRAKTPETGEAAKGAEFSSENKQEKFEGNQCEICKQLLSECLCPKQPDAKPRKSVKSDEVEYGEKSYPCPACKGDQWELYLKSCNYSNSPEKSFQRRNKSSSALDLRPKWSKLQPLLPLEETKENVQKIAPGVLDENIQKIFDSVQEKLEAKTDAPLDVICKEIKALPRNVDRRGSQEDGEVFLKNLQVLDYPNETNGEKMEKKEFLKKPEPGYQIAKRFHDENLKHKPLPDVVDDPVFKALTSSRQTTLGDVLKIDSGSSAIGWKPYSAPRPTECSKLKVFRPKTAVDKVKLQKDARPKTSAYKKRFLPIDLAICWDLKPDDPSDEPKRSPHIDGSNGSIAPAVFTMIKPSLDEDEQNVQGSPQPLAEKILQGIEESNAVNLPSQVNGKARAPVSVTNREAIMTCVRSPQEGGRKPKTSTPDSLNSISPNAAEYARKNPKTAWTSEDTSKALSDRLQSLQNGKYKKILSRTPSDSSQMLKKNHHQSTPNLTTVCDGSHCGTEKSTPVKCTKPRLCGSANGKPGQKKRDCSACKNPNYAETPPKEEFKSAFKAGVPKSESSNSASSGAKSYKVPKMRLPYAKRSYSIGTLVPPFSIWPEGNGQEYPEHWRLASVYQHSYKPINNRRRPLLASVYQ